MYLIQEGIKFLEIFKGIGGQEGRMDKMLMITSIQTSKTEVQMKQRKVVIQFLDAF